MFTWRFAKHLLLEGSHGEQGGHLGKHGERRSRLLVLAQVALGGHHVYSDNHSIDYKIPEVSLEASEVGDWVGEFLGERQRAFRGGEGEAAAGASLLQACLLLGTTRVFSNLTNDKCVDVAAGGKVCNTRALALSRNSLVGDADHCSAWLPISGLSR